MYWQTQEGRRRPPYLDLCLSTIERWKGGLRLHVLDLATVESYLPGLPPRAFELSPNHFSDFIRSRLLYRYGGMWLDADVIALRPLEELLGLRGSYGTLLYGEEGKNISANFVASSPGSPLMGTWMHRQDSVLEVENPAWNAFGKAALVDAATGHAHKTLSRSLIAPLPWQEWRKLLSMWPRPSRYLRDDPYLFMLYNKFLSEALADVGVQELLRGRTLISKLFRIALDA